MLTFCSFLERNISGDFSKRAKSVPSCTQSKGNICSQNNEELDILVLNKNSPDPDEPQHGEYQLCFLLIQYLKNVQLSLWYAVIFYVNIPKCK